jgi:hypothetical protein
MKVPVHRVDSIANEVEAMQNRVASRLRITAPLAPLRTP